jgi:hypothetical protein
MVRSPTIPLGHIRPGLGCFAQVLSLATAFLLTSPILGPGALLLWFRLQACPTESCRRRGHT